MNRYILNAFAKESLVGVITSQDEIVARDHESAVLTVSPDGRGDILRIAHARVARVLLEFVDRDRFDLEVRGGHAVSVASYDLSLRTFGFNCHLVPPMIVVPVQNARPTPGPIPLGLV